MAEIKSVNELLIMNLNILDYSHFRMLIQGLGCSELDDMNFTLLAERVTFFRKQ